MIMDVEQAEANNALPEVAPDIDAYKPQPTELEARTNFLASMIEPTQEMLNSTENIVVGFDDFACGDGTLYASLTTSRSIYRAMILNALAKAIRDEHNALVDEVNARAIDEDEQNARLQKYAEDNPPHWMQPYTEENTPDFGG